MIEQNAVRAIYSPLDAQLWANPILDTHPEKERLNMAFADKGINWTAEEILWKLGKCENGNRLSGCIIDINGKPSCGQFMFQRKTFENYCPELEYGNPRDEMVCAVRLISLGKGHTYEGWFNCWRIEKLPIIYQLN